MKVLFTILVTFFAGMGAGLGTGFAGMSNRVNDKHNGYFQDKSYPTQQTIRLQYSPYVKAPDVLYYRVTAATSFPVRLELPPDWISSKYLK